LPDLLKEAILPQNLENWYAIIGTSEIGAFSLHDGEGTNCLYAEDLSFKVQLYGTQFRTWERPIAGLLIFVGSSDGESEITSITEVAIQKLQEKFQRARVGKLRNQLKNNNCHCFIV